MMRPTVGFNVLESAWGKGRSRTAPSCLSGTSGRRDERSPSLFVKKPSRLPGLLMVITLALFVYSVAQRQMRPQLARQHDTLPNQSGQLGSRPTLRWLFQLLEGINCVPCPCQGMS